MKKQVHITTVIVILFLFLSTVHAQSITTFTVNDFSLNGAVKSCTILTPYGKEMYDFDTQGRLVKAVTRYNENDYEVSYYRFMDSRIAEKREEYYENNTIDNAKSVAYIFALDTLTNILSEKIITYSKTFLEYNEFHFDSIQRLKRIKHLDAEGIDETRILYDTLDSKFRARFMVNNQLQKEEYNYETVAADKKDSIAVIYTKWFANGIAEKAERVRKNRSGVLKDKTLFTFNIEGKRVPIVTLSYVYNEQQAVKKITTSKDGKTAIQEFVYQYDGKENGNWVKQIVLPDNTYTTRKVTYYLLENKQNKE